LGEVWLLLLEEDGSIKEALRYTNDQNGFPKKGLKTGDQFGCSLSAYGAGSGILFVGALGDDKADLNAGAIWRLRIQSDGQLSEAQKITHKQGFGPKLKAQDRWGTSLATIGDWNADGRAELAVSASRADDGGRDMGTVYILFLDSLQNVQWVNRFYQEADNFSGKLSSSYNFGRSLAKGPDHNQDGEADLLISGHLDDETGPNQGAFWVVSPQLRSAANAKTSQLEQRSLSLTAQDSAWIYRDAVTALDSARMDSLYDLSSYAPSHLIFVLDVSASMNKPWRLPLLREAFLNLLVYMRPEDKISVVAYSSKAETLLSNLSAAERDSIAATVEVLASSGSTKPTKAVEIAYALANRHLIPNGNNRIIFATDGGFDSEVLDKPLDKFASSDIPLSVFYFGKLPADKIAEMELLAQKAFGNTAHILPETVNSALLNEVRVIQQKTEIEEH
ncbi:MAG: VWA domain-containing protein, partial [Bacteroidota bacterium]